MSITMVTPMVTPVVISVTSTMMTSKDKRTLVLRSVSVFGDQSVQEECLDGDVLCQHCLRQSPHLLDGKVSDEVDVCVL